MIRGCNCKHDGQDRLHGRGQRVHNQTVKGTWRCTVCGDEKGGDAVKFGKKKGKK